MDVKFCELCGQVKMSSMRIAGLSRLINDEVLTSARLSRRNAITVGILRSCHDAGKQAESYVLILPKRDCIVCSSRQAT